MLWIVIVVCGLFCLLWQVVESTSTLEGAIAHCLLLYGEKGKADIILWCQPVIYLHFQAGD